MSRFKELALSESLDLWRQGSSVVKHQLLCLEDKHLSEHSYLHRAVRLLRV